MAYIWSIGSPAWMLTGAGPYGHEMMGMIVAMKLLQHLQNVAGDIEGTKPENAVGSGARKWADNQIENLPRPPDDLPPPQVCAEEICGTPSHCATTLEPHVEQVRTVSQSFLLLPVCRCIQRAVSFRWAENFCANLAILFVTGCKCVEGWEESIVMTLNHQIS